METKKLICIGCPMGCPLEVVLEAGEIQSVTGYTCKRGEDYARKEVTNPMRTVTTTVRVVGSRDDVVSLSCKTERDIPKESIFACISDLAGVEVAAPIHIGDVIKANVAGTGVDVIATKNVE